jgi:hypothetical protein
MFLTYFQSTLAKLDETGKFCKGDWVETHFRGAENVITLYYFPSLWTCLNFNHGKFGAFFSNFLHNMVDHNTKNSIKKKFSFSNLYCVIPKYICGKKMYVTMYGKMQIY